MTSDDRAFGVGCLLGAAFAVLACGVLLACLLHWQNSRWEDAAIQRGAAQIDPNTGDWGWQPAKAGEY